MDELQVYQNEDGSIALDVTLKSDSVWLSLAQMEQLFGRDRSVIGKHVNNVFKDGELVRESVGANFAHTAADGKTYKVIRYNLDVIISVGYRVKSPQGVKFRQWATNVIKEHLLEGYTLNKQRLQENATELEKALQLVKRAAALPHNAAFGAGLVDIISSYTQTFLWLQQYDEGLLETPKGQYGGNLTALADSRAAIGQLKKQLMAKGEATQLFANERQDGLAAIWGALEQSVFGEPAYPTLESKAAHLLYFVVKNYVF